MGADEDGGVFLVKIDFGGLFLLGKSCSHRLILSAALSRNNHPLVRLSEKLFNERRVLDFHRIVFDIPYRKSLMEK